ncbi:unnamed protein product, partial [Mesorhabditis spiculigera]
MADPNQPPASDDEQLKTATSSSPRSNGPAISAQSFATDMCVTANVTNTQRDESPHTTFTNMSASTCRITDPRLSDTSAGGSSPQRTAAHARPSRSALPHRHFRFSSPLYQPRPYRKPDDSLDLGSRPG